MTELVVLPSHLIERIRQILAADLEIPQELRHELQAGVKDQPSSPSETEGEVEVEGDESKSPLPPTVDINVLERLSRWVKSDDKSTALISAGLGQSRSRILSHNPRGFDG